VNHTETATRFTREGGLAVVCGFEEGTKEGSGAAVEQRRTDDDSVEYGALDDFLFERDTPGDEGCWLTRGGGFRLVVVAVVAVDPCA
jgi:hypothetical protein